MFAPCLQFVFKHPSQMVFICKWGFSMRFYKQQWICDFCSWVFSKRMTSSLLQILDGWRTQLGREEGGQGGLKAKVLVRPLDNSRAQLETCHGLLILSCMCSQNVVWMLSILPQHILHHSCHWLWIYIHRILLYHMRGCDYQRWWVRISWHLSVQGIGIIIWVNIRRPLGLWWRKISGPAQCQIQIRFDISPIGKIKSPNKSFNSSIWINFVNLHCFFLVSLFSQTLSLRDSFNCLPSSSC